jgi:hypothetical protein
VEIPVLVYEMPETPESERDPLPFFDLDSASSTADAVPAETSCELPASIPDPALCRTSKIEPAPA